jgi:hypothetical protein
MLFIAAFDYWANANEDERSASSSLRLARM